MVLLLLESFAVSYGGGRRGCSLMTGGGGRGPPRTIGVIADSAEGLNY